jgi:hypothetical protein
MLSNIVLNLLSMRTFPSGFEHPWSHFNQQLAFRLVLKTDLIFV